MKLELEERDIQILADLLSQRVVEKIRTLLLPQNDKETYLTVDEAAAYLKVNVRG